MADRYVRRSSSLDAGVSQKGVANSIRVDSTSELLKFGTGASGTTEKTVATLDGLAPVSVTAATLALAPATHGGQMVVINRAAGCAVTLPAATGSGVKYRVYIGTTLTSGSFSLAVGNASDYFRGFAYTTQDGGGAGIDWATANTGTVATESDTLTWNRTTTGLATQGDYVEVIDLATNVWAIESAQNSNGTEATPFSAAV